MNPLNPDQTLRHFTWRMVGLYALVWLACLAPFAIEGTLPGSLGSLGADTNRLFVPFRAFLLRQFWAFNFPDCAMGMYLGHPILTYGQTGMLYPTNLLGLIIPLPHHAFFFLDLWIHATLASAGMAWMVRRRGHRMLAALLIGWVYANSSAFLLRTDGHWTLLHQAALLPWMLGLWESLDNWRSSGNCVRSRVLLAIVLGLMLLAQNPQWLYLFALLLAPLEALRTVRRHHRLSPLRRWGGLLLIAVGALLLGAAGYLPAILGRGDSARAASAGMRFIDLWTLAPDNLLALISPYYYFGEKVWQFSGKWWPNESVAIVGRGTMLLAGIGFISLLRTPKRLSGRAALPLILILGGLAIGIAPEFPNSRGIVAQLPFFTSFRAWGRALIAVVIGLLLLAAEGIDRLNIGRSKREARSGILLGMGALAAFASALWDSMGAEPWRPEKLSSWGAKIHQGFPIKMDGLFFSTVKADILIRDLLCYGTWTILLLAIAVRGRRQWTTIAIAVLLAAELFSFQRFVFRERSPVLTPESVPELADFIDRRRAGVAPAPLTVTFNARELKNFALHLDGIRSLSGVDADMSSRRLKFLNILQGISYSAYELDSMVFGVPSDLALNMTGAQVVVEGDDFSPPVGGEWQQIDGYWIRFFPQRHSAIELQPADAGEVDILQWTDDELTAVTNSDEPTTLAFWNFGVPPYDIDGQLRESGHGRLSPGQHRIHYEYVDWRARIAFAISIVSWFGLGLFLLIRQRRKSSMAASNRSVAAR
ncbi:hypothetical protein KQI84_02505 [bacterium]|nr:hypothetical protein [bacterium]